MLWVIVITRHIYNYNDIYDFPNSNLPKEIIRQHFLMLLLYKLEILDKYVVLKKQWKLWGSEVAEKWSWRGIHKVEFQMVFPSSLLPQRAWSWGCFQIIACKMLMWIQQSRICCLDWAYWNLRTVNVKIVCMYLSIYFSKPEKEGVRTGVGWEYAQMFCGLCRSSEMLPYTRHPLPWVNLKMQRIWTEKTGNCPPAELSLNYLFIKYVFVCLTIKEILKV